jgi:enamine deaminase RidA (YjgF/YER057c/UK114 family)
MVQQLFKGDLYNQTKFGMEIIKQAIEKAGGKLENIIRTRIMLKDISIWKEAAKAHGEYFSEIRPVCTFVQISRFINEDWLVEIEADCMTD